MRVAIASWLVTAAIMSAPTAADLSPESIGGRSDWNGKTYFGKVRYMMAAEWHSPYPRTTTRSVEALFNSGFVILEAGTVLFSTRPSGTMSAVVGP